MAEGRWLVTGDQTPSVHLYDFTRDCPLHIQGYETKVKAMDFSPDGKRLATGGGAKVTVWNCTGKTGPEGTIPDQRRCGDHRLVADRRIPRNGRRRWTPRLLGHEGPACLRFRGCGGDQCALAWSPDGKYLAAGVARGRVALFSD
jgi:WD40 repeat protein